MKKAAPATATVMAPSMMKSQRHARSPRAPSMLLVIAAAMRPEKAPEMSEPAKRYVVRTLSSLRVYQQLR